MVNQQLEWHCTTLSLAIFSNLSSSQNLIALWDGALVRRVRNLLTIVALKNRLHWFWRKINLFFYLSKEDSPLLYVRIFFFQGIRGNDIWVFDNWYVIPKASTISFGSYLNSLFLNYFFILDKKLNNLSSLDILKIFKRIKENLILYKQFSYVLVFFKRSQVFHSAFLD